MARLVLSLSAALLALMGVAAPSGLLVANALAQPKRPDDHDDTDAPLLVLPSKQPADYLAHRSHSSHSSHRSHSSHYSGSGRSYSGTPDPAPYVPSPAPQPVEPPAPPPPPPQPARVSFAAYPGGRIYVDGKLAGIDTTTSMVLAAGSHTIRVENRFVGDHNASVQLNEGQTGVVDITW